MKRTNNVASFCIDRHLRGANSYWTAGQAQAAHFYHRQRQHQHQLRPPYEAELGVHLVQHVSSVTQHCLWMYFCPLERLLTFTLLAEPCILGSELGWRFFLTFLFSFPLVSVPADSETYSENWMYYTNQRNAYLQVREEDEVEEPLLSQVIVQCASLGSHLLAVQDGVDGYLQDALFQLTVERRQQWMGAVADRLRFMTDLHPYFRSVAECISL